MKIPNKALKLHRFTFDIVGSMELYYQSHTRSIVSVVHFGIWFFFVLFSIKYKMGTDLVVVFHIIYGLPLCVWIIGLIES